MRGSRNARKLGQNISQPTARVWVRSLANCAIPPGGKPSVRSAIRVCQRGTPRGNARVGADIRRRSRRARCGEHNRYVEYPEARKKRGKLGRVRADPARSARGVRVEIRRGQRSRVPGRTPVRKGQAGGARKRARAAHLLVVLVQIFVRVGHLSRHRLRLIVKDGFIPDDGQRLADVDGPSPERRTRHLRCAPSCSARDSPLCPNYRGGVSLPGRWHGDAMYLKDRSYRPSHSRHPRIESRRSKRVSTRPCVRGSALSAVGRQR